LEDAEWPKIAQLHHFVEGVGGGEGVRSKGTGGRWKREKEMQG